MARVYNLGSINLDRTINVSHFPKPGETIDGKVFEDSLGGKGLNVSVALQKAGQSVVHIGAVNHNDKSLSDMLDRFEIDQTFVEQSDHPSGQAYIFLDKEAENSIVVCGGANIAISHDHINQALENGSKDDWLVLQNETNGQAKAVEIALGKKMKVALVVTKGAAGAVLITPNQTFKVDGKKVVPRDTTGAGDTFFGYFLACWIAKETPQICLELANAAAALAVQKNGAANSVPAMSDVRAATGD
jgi:ribokinase